MAMTKTTKKNCWTSFTKPSSFTPTLPKTFTQSHVNVYENLLHFL